MKKTLSALLATVMLATGMVGCDTATPSSSEPAASTSTSTAASSTPEVTPTGGELNIFTWDGYFPQDVLDGFTTSTGIKLNFSHFESNEEMLTKLSATGGGEYDLIIASDYIIDIARKQGGLLMELDKDKLPNFANMDEAYLDQYYDPGNVYTVPYAPGTPLIVYDPAVVDVEVTGFNSLWDPAFADNLVVMDDPRVLIGMSLLSMGKSMNETDEATIVAAGDKLIELKPNIRVMAISNLQTNILSGEVVAGYMYATQASTAIMENPELKVVYPEEGMGFGIDSMFIAEGAPNADEAHQFINYIMDAEVGAKVATQVMVPCPNVASREFLPEWFTSNPALYIPSDELGNTEFIEDVGEATAIYDRVWTEFKQA